MLIIDPVKGTTDNVITTMSGLARHKTVGWQSQDLVVRWRGGRGRPSPINIDPMKGTTDTTTMAGLGADKSM